MKIRAARGVLGPNIQVPGAARGGAALKSPLAYSLREYAVILGIALLGGFASWYSRVRRGQAELLSFSALVGELAVSAFAGLITFWVCESFELSPLVTAAAAGMAGHAGGTGISWMERIGKRYAEKRFGLTAPAHPEEKP